MVRRSSAAPVALAARVCAAACWAATALLVLSVSGSPASAQTWVSSVGPLNLRAAIDAGDDHWPVVVSDRAGKWITVWESDESYFVGPDHDILIAASVDNGATWSLNVVNSNAFTDKGDDYRPQIATDRAGNWVAVWYSDERLCNSTLTNPPDPKCNTYPDIGLDTDILWCRSTDNGATWTAPDRLNSNAATDWGWDWYPQVATDGAGKWVVVWQSGEWLGGTIGTDKDILWVSSSDNGVTWTDPAPLNTNAASDSGDDRYPQVATDGAGTWVVVWRSNDSLDGTIGTDEDVLWARWDGVAATWTDPAPLNTNAASDTKGDFRPQVATDPEGTWVAVWHSETRLCDPAVQACYPASACNPYRVGCDIGTDTDILWARWDGVGATWTDPTPLNTNAAVDPQNAKDYFAGAAVWPANDPAGNWVAIWNSSVNKDPVTDAAIGGDFDLLWARWNGVDASWTAPRAFNSTAAPDSRDDLSPYAASDGAGNWVVVWHSHDRLCDPGVTPPPPLCSTYPDVGEDADIFVTRGWGPDGDADQLADGAEISVHGTDPLDADSDDDGLPDGAEVDVHGTDPLDADSDGDGLSDGAEVDTYGTDPLARDTDGDHFGDGYEIAEGSDPLDADSQPLIPVPALAPLGRALAALLLALAAGGWLARRRA